MNSVNIVSEARIELSTIYPIRFLGTSDYVDIQNKTWISVQEVIWTITNSQTQTLRRWLSR